MPSNRHLLIIIILLILVLPIGTSYAQSSALTVTINDVQAQPLPDEAAYQVTAFVSVIDSLGRPVTAISQDEFRVTEDGQEVDLSRAQTARRNANIVLVLDTSGSMLSEGKMEAVKGAAQGFIEALNAGDQVAVVQFNNEVSMGQSLDDNLGNVLRYVDTIEASPNSGTCLYDAAYTGIEVASGAPRGQRAVVLLTDGIDELYGQSGPCSSREPDDVINLASANTTRVPIFTIGVGSRVNADELDRIAFSTGGNSLLAQNASEVSSQFNAVATLVTSQYEVTYISTAVTGEHNLTIEVTQGDSTGVGTRTFVAPPLLTLSGLDNGAILNGAQTVRATMGGDSRISEVRFLVDEEEVATDSSAPFEYELDSADFEPGEYEFTVTAFMQNGDELTRTIGFEVQEAGAAPVVNDTADTTATEPEAEAEETTSSSLPGWVLPIGFLAVLLVAGGIVLFVTVLKPKEEKPKPGISGAGDMTQDIGFGISIATLTVRKSMSLPPGQVLDITQERTKVGRGADNDIIIPDAPVSRSHMEIQHEDDAFRAYDLGSNYGTFVNGDPVGQSGISLRDGDEIQLGTRTIVVFSTPQGQAAGLEDKTLDDFAGFDPDATQDEF